MKYLLFLGLPLLSAVLAGCTQEKPVAELPVAFDWQGHRGARGLVPENTVPAFLKALQYPAILTLEMDASITKDSVVILSHEPWMSRSICTKPDGTSIPEEQEKKYKLFQMTVEEVQQFDCGKIGNAAFPQQQPLPVSKPTLRQAISAIENYCKETGRPLPYYNIEIKSNPQWDSLFTPLPATFAALLLKEIKWLGIENRTCIQSFDLRSLQETKKLDSLITTALLVEDAKKLEETVKTLGFVPSIYSPHFENLNDNLVQKAHQMNMKVIPWTVNDTLDMQKLIQMGVDGIITDYPDRTQKFFEGAH